ncbi:MAG: hypothetical protein IPG53_21400 [Ignavibacteriales bacterium]|nr:hypothetical protein [Ignavibacteriales bacterium]
MAYPEYSLNSVDVYLRDIPHNGFFLNIYRGGNSSAPGALVYKSLSLQASFSATVGTTSPLIRLYLL